MWDILRDPLWQFIGAVLVVLGIIISVVVLRQERHRKKLSYEIISSTPLLSSKEEISGKLQILFKGNPVEDVHLIEIKIANSGNMPITSAEYERPVNFGFGDKAQILTAEVIETNPKNLEAPADIQAGRIVLAPVLLNSGDTITLRMLISQFDGHVNVDGRIVGVKEIKKSAEKTIQSLVITICGMVITLVSLILFIKATPNRPPPEEFPLSKSWPYLSAFGIGYVMMFIGMFRYRGFRRFFRLGSRRSTSPR